VSCFTSWGQQDEVSEVGQHFAVSSLLINFTVIIAPAIRIITIKTILFQRLFFFFGVQQFSLPQQQSCFELL
jgi:hypothetical protein